MANELFENQEIDNDRYIVTLDISDRKDYSTIIEN